MENRPSVRVQIVIPARNEQDCLGLCLQSLVSQQGIRFAITVVDDASTDCTRQIAESFPGVHVIGADEPAPGVSGKCNAIIQGVQSIEGPATEWLLFTDADTVHHPGSLASAVGEAEERNVDLLSYSPEQETKSWSERALMPVVFADLARAYPPERVNDPADASAAANGQYLLVRRAVYEALGGHATVADKILEDVELAKIFKALGHRAWFRQGVGLVSARMYRDFRSLVEGWTKNLNLLFRHPLRLAAMRGLEFFAIALLLALAIVLGLRREWSIAFVDFGIAALFYAAFLQRILRAHFPPTANLMSLLGLPIFAWLLVRSWLHTRLRGAVTWKGRSYRQSASRPPEKSSISGRSELESRRS